MAASFRQTRPWRPGARRAGEAVAGPLAHGRFGELVGLPQGIGPRRSRGARRGGGAGDIGFRCGTRYRPEFCRVPRLEPAHVTGERSRRAEGVALRLA
jgi:hypothetical protein